MNILAWVMLIKYGEGILKESTLRFYLLAISTLHLLRGNFTIILGEQFNIVP